jgi:cytochrome c553
MNRKPAAKRLWTAVLAACGLVFSITAHAQSEDVAEKVAICTTCHGENGMPTEQDIPIIWGQEFYYLYVQLKDYKAGRRANDIMQGMVADLSKEQMQALAQYFAEKPWPQTSFSVTDADRSEGETALSSGQCSQCHLGDYNGNSRIPRLAGQQPNYLERTMLDFKNKVRMNAPDKGVLMRAYSEEAIAAMAHTLAAK